jgi:hypothetical protein
VIDPFYEQQIGHRIGNTTEFFQQSFARTRSFIVKQVKEIVSLLK